MRERRAEGLVQGAPAKDKGGRGQGGAAPADGGADWKRFFFGFQRPSSGRLRYPKDRSLYPELPDSVPPLTTARHAMRQPHGQPVASSKARHASASKVTSARSFLEELESDGGEEGGDRVASLQVRLHLCPTGGGGVV